MRLMLSYLKRYKGLVFLNFISVFGFALTELGIPTIISRMVDGGVASGDREYLLKMGGLIALISVVAFSERLSSVIAVPEFLQRSPAISEMIFLKRFRVFLIGK